MKYVRRIIDMPLSYFVEEGDTNFFPILPGQTRMVNLSTGLKKYYQYLLNKVDSIADDYGIVNADTDFEEMGGYQFVMNFESQAAVPRAARSRKLNKGIIINNGLPLDLVVMNPTPPPGGTKLLLKNVTVARGTSVIFQRLTTKSGKYVLSIKNKSQTKNIKGLGVKMNYVSTFPMLTRKIPMAFFQNAFDKIWNKRDKRFIKFYKDHTGKMFLYFDEEFAKLYGFPQYKILNDPLPVIDCTVDDIIFSFKIFSRNSKPYIEWKIVFKKGKLVMPWPISDIGLGDREIIFEFDFPSLKVKCKFLDDIVGYFKNLGTASDMLNQIAGAGDAVREKRDKIYKSLDLGVYGYADVLFSWIMGRYDYHSVLYVASNSQNINIYYTDFIPEKPKLIDDFLEMSDTAIASRAAVAKKVVKRGAGIGRIHPVPLPPNSEKVDHVVVLMMENRSYDQMLGYLSMDSIVKNKHEINGLTGNEFNKDKDGNSFSVTRQTKTKIDPGPAHESENMLTQMMNKNGEIDMSGFVRDYAMRLKDWTPSMINKQLPTVMSYYTGAELPVTDYLARQFAICNQWFCSHAGPTLTNRFITLHGDVLITDEGRIFENHPEHFKDFRPVQQKTLFDHLSEKKVSWNYFETEYCTLRLYGKYTFDMDNVVAMEEFYKKAADGQLPSVSFIDPDFIDIPPGNDDHPPADMRRGQKLMYDIIKALQESPKWNKTLLLITYDENGGFYDHVPPTSLAANERFSTNEATYGPRVPTFVISPYVPHEKNFITVSNKLYDHTSIGATILRKFCNKDVPILSRHMDKANDIWDMLSLEVPRTITKIKPLSKAYLKGMLPTDYKFGKDIFEDDHGFHHLMMSSGFFFRS